MAGGAGSGWSSPRHKSIVVASGSVVGRSTKRIAPWSLARVTRVPRCRIGEALLEKPRASRRLPGPRSDQPPRKPAPVAADAATGGGNPALENS